MIYLFIFSLFNNKIEILVWSNIVSYQTHNPVVYDLDFFAMPSILSVTVKHNVTISRVKLSNLASGDSYWLHFLNSPNLGEFPLMAVTNVKPSRS